MKSKNVKIVDEHGIDRIANVICSIDVDGSDYVIYWIERDDDNDNLFVSKLIKNNDDTSNMINIEDSMEKSKLGEIVKELITCAINDVSDKLSSNVVSLKSGKNIKLSNVLFNKEQNINVQKTYITTVKKSVTNVSEKYYDVQDNVGEVVEDKNTETVMPQTVEQVVSVVEPVVTPVQNTVSESMPQAAPEILKPTEQVLEIQPTVQPQVVKMPEKIEEVPVPVVETPTVVLEPPIVEKAPTVENQNSFEQVVSPNVTLASVINSKPTEVNTNFTPVTTPTPVAVAPDIVTNAPKNDNVLFFDGSNETNLTGVFNATNEQPKVAVETITPIREFGQDVPVVDNVEPNMSNNSGSGFANNNFLVIIAIMFFLASCVFLGYEVFRYFQMK